MDKPIKEIRQKEPVITASTKTQGVDNKMSLFPYAASAMSKAEQNLGLSVFERHCIDFPGLFSDLLFKGYALKNILSFRLISKTICEFINLRNFLGVKTNISFWYNTLCQFFDKSSQENQQKIILRINDIYEVNRMIKLLLSNFYDKELIARIESIDLKVVAINNDSITTIDKLLSAICKNLPSGLETVSIGRICRFTMKDRITFKLPKEFSKITTLFIKEISDATFDLRDAFSGLSTLDIAKIGPQGSIMLPKEMNNLEAFYLRSMPIADCSIPTTVTLPAELNKLLTLHIGDISSSGDILLPKSLNELRHLRIESLGGRKFTLPKELPNLISLFIGRVGTLSLPDSFPNLTTLSIGWIQTYYTDDLLFPKPRGVNLKLPNSLPSLTDLSIGEIFHKTDFTLPLVEKLKKLSIDYVDLTASFQVTRELDNLETLIIKNLESTNKIKLSAMPNLKRFTIEKIGKWGVLVFPGTLDTLKALDTNVVNNEEFELQDSGKNSTYIRTKKR